MLITVTATSHPISTSHPCHPVGGPQPQPSRFAGNQYLFSCSGIQKTLLTSNEVKKPSHPPRIRCCHTPQLLKREAVVTRGSRRNPIQHNAACTLVTNPITSQNETKSTSSRRSASRDDLEQPATQKKTQRRDRQAGEDQGKKHHEVPCSHHLRLTTSSRIPAHPEEQADEWDQRKPRAFAVNFSGWLGHTLGRRWGNFAGRSHTCDRTLEAVLESRTSGRRGS